VHLALPRRSAQGELTGSAVCSSVAVLTSWMAVKTALLAAIFRILRGVTLRNGIF